MLLFFLFLVTDIFFLIPTIIAQFFNSLEELVIRIRMPTKEEKEEIEIHPVIVEDRIRKYSI